MSEIAVQNQKEQIELTENENTILQEQVKKPLSDNDGIQFESLTDYELPPRTQFAVQNKPAVTLRGNKMQFSMSAVRLFKDCRYIIPMINPKTKRLSIIPCTEEEGATVEWSRIQAKTGKFQSKQITSEEFFRKIFEFMGWRQDCRYKIIGRLALSEHGKILVFDLEEAIMHAPKKQQVVDPISGKIKMKEMKYYPERYKTCFGRTYSDYIATKEQDDFEHIGGYELLANVDLQNAAESTTSTSVLEEVAAEESAVMLPEMEDSTVESEVLSYPEDKQKEESRVALVV